MKKLFVMAAMVLSSVGAFAQQAAGTTTIQPKVGLNVSTIGDNDWKAGFAAGAELQYQATDNLGVAVGAFAQQAAGTTTLQPKVGLNVSTIGDNDWKAGFAAGAELQYQASSNLGVAVGALYSVQGFKAKDVKVAGMTFEGGKWNPGYINVPITLNYYPVAGLALKAGLQPGFLVNKDDAEDVKTVDLSIPVGLSYEYQNIVFDARYNIGVTKVADNWDHYNNVIQITVGYKFAL